MSSVQPTYPMKSSGKRIPHSKMKPLGYYLARLMTLVTLFNFSWVLFDATYISLRDIYLARLPVIPVLYDRVKAIEPFRDTDHYLKTVAKFEALLAEKSLESPESQVLLQDLRDQSTAMVETNPFQLANKSGTLEKIKNRMRDRLKLDSSKESFRQFWSLEHLSAAPDDLRWFQANITPLVARNYFRPTGESGQFKDFFWLIDIGFVGVFGLDILIRMFIIRRRRPGLTWADALLWRWYDLLLLMPFWRLLRIIPVLLRCHQVQWIPLNRIQNQMNQYLAENLVEDLSELVLVRSVSMAQSAIRGGVIKQWLATDPEFVEINNVNELQVIIERLLLVMVTKVLPKSQSELESVMRHAIEQGLAQVPVFQGLKYLPGANILPHEIAKQVVSQFTQVTAGTLQQTLQDEKGQALSAQFAQRVIEETRIELQDPMLLKELQGLLTDMLEEVKLTLIKSLESQDVEQTATEVAQLRQKKQRQNQIRTVDVFPSRAAIVPRNQNIS